MIKNTVINAELGYALATARHKDAIVICDANMPIPDGCNVIDVSLIRGVPTLEQTMCAILNDLVAGGLKDLSVMGTMHEVGYWEGAINESTPCKPQSQYGIAKNALRQSLMLSLDGSPCKLHWLRAYYITGDEVHGSSIFAKITQAEQDGKKTFPFTSGSNLYDFIDVDELANMIVAASVQEEINGIINVCTGKPMSLADRVEQFLRDKNYKIKLDYGAFPDRPYDSPGTWGDPTKINRILANDTCKRA